MTRSFFKRQQGFSLVEVLVALAILSIGLLGLAGLQATSHIAQNEALAKAQALVLAQDMAERIASNRGNAKLGSSSSYNSATTYGTGNADSTCSTSPGNPAELAAKDLCEWDLALKGATQTIGGNRAAVVSQARGCISLQTTPITQFVVSVAWAGNSSLGSVPADRTCGSAAIPEARRVVSMTVPLANLTN